MILFTGLGGLTGGALADRLIRERYAGPVRLLSRSRSARDKLIAGGISCEEMMGDIRHEETLKKAMQGVHTVCHLAAKERQDLIARAAAESGCVRRVIMISSTSIFSRYYKTQIVRDKEEAAITLLQQAGIEYTILRPTMIFDGVSDKNIRKFAAMVRKLPVMPIVGGGKALLQPVHKCDLADACWRVINHPEESRNQIYTVSGHAPMSLRDMLTTLARVQGKKIRFINIPMPLAVAAVRLAYVCSLRKIDYREQIFRLCEDRAFDHDEISRQLGYQPEPFETRLRQTLKQTTTPTKEGDQ